MSYKTFLEEANINDNHLDYRYSNHFQSDSLLDKLGLTLCNAGIISKKEYCESMEVIKALQRLESIDNFECIYDICGGHGLTAILLAVLSTEKAKIYIVDLKKPDSFGKMMNCFIKDFPFITKKIEFINSDYREVSYSKDSLMLGIHACGVRTDEILDLGIENNCNILIMPCCYKKKSLPDEMKKYTDIYKLRDLVDITRISLMHSRGYKSFVKIISEKITPMNKIFFFKLINK